MILKTISFTLTVFCFTCYSGSESKNLKYSLADLENLKEPVTKSLNGLQYALQFTYGDTVCIPSIVMPSNVKAEEINCIPRFKSLYRTRIDELNIWFDKQTPETVNQLLTNVDKHKTIEELINWQNTHYPKNLPMEDGFKRLVESAHLKSKNYNSGYSSNPNN